MDTHLAQGHVESGCGGFTIPEKTLRRPDGRRRIIVWMVLIAYLVLLICKALYNDDGSGISNNIAVWDLQDSRRLTAWIGGLVLLSFWKFAYFAPVGFLIPIAIPRRLDRFPWLPIDLRALAAAGILAVLVYTIEISRSWHLAAAVGLVFPLLGCLFGTWMGTSWLRGRRARLWLLPKIALLVVVAIIISGILLLRSVDRDLCPLRRLA